MIAEYVANVLNIGAGDRIVSDHAPQFVETVLDVHDCDGRSDSCLGPTRHLKTDAGEVRFSHYLIGRGEYREWARIRG